MTSVERSLPAAILFDVDGTLIDSHRLYLESYRRAVTPHLGYAPSNDEISARRPSSERRFLEDWVGVDLAGPCHAEMCRHYRELHPAFCDGIYEGVREMLAGLRNAGLPLGIVTGKGRTAWEITSDALDLGAFEVIVTDDDVELPKPDPGGLLAAARALQIDPVLVAYIGDSAADIEAGRRAGMQVGAVLWAKADSADRGAFLTQIQAHAADWTFEKPADLVRTFAAWC